MVNIQFVASANVNESQANGTANGELYIIPVTQTMALLRYDGTKWGFNIATGAFDVVIP